MKWSNLSTVFYSLIPSQTCCNHEEPVCRSAVHHIPLTESKFVNSYTLTLCTYLHTFLRILNGLKRCMGSHHSGINVFAITPRKTQCIASTTTPWTKSKGGWAASTLIPVIPMTYDEWKNLCHNTSYNVRIVSTPSGRKVLILLQSVMCIPGNSGHISGSTTT